MVSLRAPIRAETGRKYLRSSHFDEAGGRCWPGGSGKDLPYTGRRRLVPFGPSALPRFWCPFAPLAPAARRAALIRALLALPLAGDVDGRRRTGDPRHRSRDALSVVAPPNVF
jgi:hypothetical protein